MSKTIILQQKEKPLFTKSQIAFFKKKRQEHVDYVADLWREIGLIVEENQELKRENEKLKKTSSRK